MAGGAIDAAQRSAYLKSYSAARTTLSALSGQRRAELGYVLDTLRSFARQKRLTARLRPMFLILDRNREWWAKAGPPGSGARLTFGASRVIFQYFPGKGLQLHPLANFGKLNGYWQGRRNGDLRSSPRIWSPSGWSATATSHGSTTSNSAVGARPGCPGWRRAPRCRRSRAPATVSPTPRSRRSARRGLGAFEQRTPRGVRVPQGNGDWYACTASRRSSTS